LLDNAAKGSPPGGTGHAARHGGVVTVEDEGPGISEADLPHVFERFYRSTASRAMPGSGLGLSIVAQVTERHAGSVEAGHAESGGTRMTLRLPGAASPKPAEPPLEARESTTASSEVLSS
ncbi:MAG: sensor histidine kinase, partial [Ornithinibacter sp.]